MGQLAENGYIVLKDVFPEDKLIPLRTLTDEIVDHYSDQSIYDPFTKYFLKHRTDQGALYDLYFRHPEYRVLVHSDRILDELEAVLGKNIFLYENSLVYKPSGKNNEVPWHQDFINRSNEPIKYIVWIALDDVTKENGALKFIPGSHKLGFLPYFYMPGETHHTRLSLDNVDVNQFQYVELKAGDVLIFHQLVIHSSDLVEIVTSRRAFRYACQGFESIYTPRSVPLVLRGGRPKQLPTFQPEETVSPKPVISNKRSFLERLINRLKREILS
jgi:phytanoyl-CoA hydroxylase